MFYYAITNNLSGEPEVNCPQCGIAGYGDKKDIEGLLLPPNHLITAINIQEKLELNETYYEVERDGRKVRIDNYYSLTSEEIMFADRKPINKIDINKSTRQLEDRVEKFTVHEFGITYQDTRLVKVVIKTN